MIDWINRHITHNCDNEGDYGIRMLMHIPVGILIGLCLLSEQMFLKYERNEDAHTEDEAWKDIAGAMVGRVIGRSVLIGIVIYLIWRFIL